MRTYLLEKCYNQNYADLVPYILANTLKSKLEIYESSLGSQHPVHVTEVPPHSTVANGSLKLHKIGEYYNGIKPVINVKTPSQARCGSPCNPIEQQRHVYSRDELLCIPSCSIKRSVRKTLFKLQIWKSETANISRARHGVNLINLATIVKHSNPGTLNSKTRENIKLCVWNARSI